MTNVITKKQKIIPGMEKTGKSKREEREKKHSPNGVYN